MLDFDERLREPQPARPAMTARAARGRRAPASRLRISRVLRLSATLLILMSALSYVISMLQPSSSPLGIRTVEWLRDNGARGLVNQVENIYYSLTAPSTGGPALKKLPKQVGDTVAANRGGGRGAATSLHVKAVPHYEPSAITPLIHPALSGEGVWRATFSERGVKHPPVLITSFRSDPSYPQMVAGVAWIDTSVANVQYYPGIQEPSVTLPSRGPEMIPTSLRYRLVAAFNSGFKLVDSGGGVVVNRHTYAPMKNGLATLVRYTSGKVNVIGWNGGPTAPANVLYARQNLPLIVNNGRPNPNLNDGPQWGATLGNAIRVWRSAVGVDSHGNLLYAAANYQTVGSLAEIMIHAGAVRAMQLDINAEWPSFITYTGPGARGAANILPGMSQSPDRYLTPDDRDFFAVYLK